MIRRRVAAGALLVLLPAVMIPTAAVADPSLPADPSATGSIGLCDRSGHPISSGRVTDKPFVWLAVASKAAPSPFGGSGHTATLYAFQPRQGVPPDQWSGDTLTASSAYTNTARPMTAATQLDFTLGDLLHEYPAVDNGLLQLRMYFGAVGVGASPQYATATIQVQGNAWNVVEGSSSYSCTDGTATSAEIDAGIVDRHGNAIGTAAASLSASAAAASAAGRSDASTTSTRAGSPTPARSSEPGSVTVPTTGSPTTAGVAANRGGGSSPLPWVLGVVAVLVLGAAALWWRRRTGTRVRA